MNGSDGRLACSDGKTKPFQPALEKFRVRPKFFNQLFANRRIKKRKGGLTRGHHRRRMSGGVQKWPRAAIQEIDQLARTANVTAHRADRFAERADLDVDPSAAAEAI